jgi:hypothetical protein
MERCVNRGTGAVRWRALLYEQLEDDGDHKEFFFRPDRTEREFG